MDHPSIEAVYVRIGKIRRLKKESQKAWYRYTDFLLSRIAFLHPSLPVGQNYIHGGFYFRIGLGSKAPSKNEIIKRESEVHDVARERFGDFFGKST